MTGTPLTSLPPRAVRAPRATPRAALSGIVCLVCTVVVAAACTTATTAVAQTHVIFTEYEFNNPQVRWIEPDGGNPELLFSPPPSEWLPVGCDYDAGSGRLYWTNGNFNAGTIRRANLDGSDMELLLGGLKLPRGMALDLVNGTMYWTNSPAAGNASGLVQRANLDGSGLETVFALVPYDPVLSFVGRPVVDPVNGYVYFCADGEILRTQLDGSPPIQTVVRGVTTVTGLALDVAGDHIYFLDANTNSDYLGRARLDDTEFSVLVDMSPGSGGSSGLVDILLDAAGGKVYWSNDILDTIRRADLDGGNVETIHASAGGASPTGLSFNVNTPQPMQDCNENGVRDLDDILGPTSDDCNNNGIPDECEEDPCAPESFLVDYSSDPELPARSLSGNPGTGYEVFQSFDVDESGVTLARIGVDGHTLSYHPAGFELTLFPDDGSGTFPDEGQPIESANFQVRFSLKHVVWVYRPFGATLSQERYWVRLTANDPTYAAGMHSGESGPPSKSRRNSTGQVTTASTSIALRIEAAPPTTAVEGSGSRGVPGVRIGAPVPNPMMQSTSITLTLERPARVRLEVYGVGGRMVRAIDARELGAGLHRIDWDGRDAAGQQLSSGVYHVLASTSAGERGKELKAATKVLIVR